MQKLKASSFDYNQLDSSVSKLLKEETSKIKDLLSATIDNIVQIGLSLIEVKENLAYGYFMEWLEAEFEMSPRTADNFMRVARCFHDANFSELEIAKSALYLLSAPSVPEDARREALEMAKTEHVSQKTAQELIEIHKEAVAFEEPVSIPTPPPAKPTSNKRQRRVETKKKTKSTPKASRFKQVKKGEIWSIGRYHRLFCGKSSALKFRKIIPNEIALLINFPEHSNEWPKSIPGNTKSAIAFYTSLEDFHFATLRETIESCVLGTADASESVVIIGLPDPSLFILLDRLDCQCICCEPDPERCTEAVVAWTTATNRQAKRI